MDASFHEFLSGELKQIREQGLFKEEWPILGEQGPESRVEGRPEPEGWRASLAADLRRPALRLSLWDALRSRFRATYAVLGHLLTLAWIAKLVSHPRWPASSAELLERLSLANLVPGWLVLVGALSLVLGATAIAISASPAEALESEER